MKKIHKNNLVYIGLAILLYYLQSIAGCGGKQIFSRTRMQMGTVVNIKLVARNQSRADQGFQAAFEEIDRVERKMSRLIKKSEIYKLNHLSLKGNSGYPVSDELYHLLERSQEYSRQTGFLFDFTMGRLTALWGFEEGRESVPPADVISSFLTRSRQVELTGGQVYFSPADTGFDLGAVAKGYGVDRAFSKLKEAGIENFIINAGGDIRAAGTKGQGRPWTIGIQNPRNNNGLIGSVQITGKAVVTSGDYERFFMEKKVRYHHILDPRTGYPARGCRSVTVVAATAEQADAIATGIFVMGGKKGKIFLENRADLEGIIIDSQGKRFISKGLIPLFHPVRQ
ncbi:MAG: FAD:protein FMN transferase [bacterium]